MRQEGTSPALLHLCDKGSSVISSRQGLANFLQRARKYIILGLRVTVSMATNGKQPQTEQWTGAAVRSGHGLPSRLKDLVCVEVQGSCCDFLITSLKDVKK